MTAEIQDNTDPLVKSSQREALIVAGIWLASMFWSVGCSAWLGYGQQSQPPQLMFGFPLWVFWGIVVPWLACAVISWWFGAFFVRDGELGQDLQDTDELGLGG
ncbi:MAG: DUF997 family protein [Planctomycetaceae bacterium]